MSHAPRESVIVRNIQKKLAPYCLIRKRHGNVNAVKGDPDLYGVLPKKHPYWPRRHFELEVKRPGESCTALQITRLFEWEEAGALSGVVTSATEAMNALRLGPGWERPDGFPPGTILEVAAKMVSQKIYRGLAEVMEGSSEYSIPVRLLKEPQLLVTIGKPEVVKVVRQP